MIINGVCYADQIISKMEGKSKEKTKTTRFHIHTDNPIDEVTKNDHITK